MPTSILKPGGGSRCRLTADERLRLLSAVLASLLATLSAIMRLSGSSVGLSSDAAFVASAARSPSASIAEQDEICCAFLFFAFDKLEELLLLEPLAIGVVVAAGDDAILSDTVLSGAVLSGTVLSDAVLSGAVLSGTVLSDNVLSDNVLSDAVLSDAVLSDAVLSDAVLSDAVLSDAVLSDAVLSDDVLSAAAAATITVFVTFSPLDNDALAPVGDDVAVACWDVVDEKSAAFMPRDFFTAGCCCCSLSGCAVSSCSSSSLSSAILLLLSRFRFLTDLFGDGGTTVTSSSTVSAAVAKEEEVVVWVSSSKPSSPSSVYKHR